MKALLIFLGIFLTLPIIHPSFAQEIKQDDVVTIRAGEKINEDFFATGKNIIISGEIDGDAYLFGENILVEGKINGDLISFSKNLTIDGVISGNLRSAAQDIQVRGEIMRNTTALGLNVEVSKSSSLNGSFAGLGREISIDSSIGKGITAGANSLNINSEINGNANVFIGENLNLGDESQINGDLTYVSGIGRNIEVSNSASISGEVAQRVYVGSNEMYYKPDSFLQSFFVFLKFIFLFSLLIVGIITVKFLPTLSENCAKEIEKAPLKNFLTGLTLLIGLPLILILLTLSLIGIPISLLLLPIYLMLIFFSQIFFIFFVGKIISEFIRKNVPSEIAFFVGFIVFASFSFVPLFSGIFSLVAICTGTGAVVFMKIKLFKKMRSENFFK